MSTVTILYRRRKRFCEI